MSLSNFYDECLTLTMSEKVRFHIVYDLFKVLIDSIALQRLVQLKQFVLMCEGHFYCFIGSNSIYIYIF